MEDAGICFQRGLSWDPYNARRVGLLQSLKGGGDHPEQGKAHHDGRSCQEEIEQNPGEHGEHIA